MAGSFATINVSKTAVRTLLAPMLLSDINTLVAEIKGVTNPFACSSYTPPGGETLDNVRTTSERYGATIQYEAAEVSIVGTVGVHAEKHTGFPTHVPVSSLILILSGQMGGDALRNATDDTVSIRLVCHDTATDEIYSVTFVRERISVSRHSIDAILTRIDTWADGKAVLAA